MYIMYVDNAVKTLEKLIDLTRTVKVSVLHKVLFCIYRGYSTPREIMDKLNISKGNLANYCKYLIANKKIQKQRFGTERGIAYQITEKGTISIEKILSNIEKICDKDILNIQTK